MPTVPYKVVVLGTYSEEREEALNNTGKQPQDPNYSRRAIVFFSQLARL